MKMYNEKDIRYLEARRKVSKLKRFYMHAAVYVLINLFIIAGNIQCGEEFSDMDNYWVAIVWGIALLAHGISVFAPNIFLGKDWEERKTRELIDKYK